MDRLIKQGKVRAIGASNYTAERLSQAIDVGKQSGYPRYQCLQTLYNLYDRSDYETSLGQLNDLLNATSLKLDHTSIELLNQASAY